MRGANRCRIPAIKLAICVLVLLGFSTPTAMSQNADADVVYVSAEYHGDRGWVFHVTVSHPDTGWDDYCNGWNVVTDSGNVLKINATDTFTRLLLHPHENEQPFTRSQGRLTIPDSVTHVTVRAHDLVSGFGGREIIVNLLEDKGEDYEISRF
jgi:hypothetical protein